MSNNKYSFICDYLDYMASLVRKYQLFFYPEDNSIEMFDLKNKKVFLKKIQYPSVKLKDLFIGAEISIYGRKLKVTDYCDPNTKSIFEKTRQSTYAMIKPDAYLHIGKIIDRIYAENLTISKLKMIKFSTEDAQEFYKEHKDRDFYKGLVEFMSSDYIVGMELVGLDAIKAWRNLLGPTNSEKARSEDPESIRALFGTDGRKNACHGSDSPESAARELGFIFGSNYNTNNNNNKLSSFGGSKVKNIPQLSNCSCLIIKPHSIMDGEAGGIIDLVLSHGFEISCMEMFYLNKNTTEEFFEVYKGVLPEYAAITEHISSGPVIAMEVRQENVVKSLRNLVGPHDPEIAKILRPKTIRALFGKDRVKNSVHCTDLEDDGVLEVQYFFELLQEK